jgi:hypothetical protein
MEMPRRLLIAMMALASGLAIAAWPSLVQATDDDAGGYSDGPDETDAVPDAEHAPATDDQSAPTDQGDDNAATPDDDEGQESDHPE